MRHALAAAIASDDTDLKAWLNVTRGVSAYTLCAALDARDVPVGDEASSAVRATAATA